MKNLLILFLVMILISSSALAQIRGKILDANDNSSLPFATIIGPDSYAIANEEGEFTYRGKIGDRLAVSFLGFRDTVLLAEKDMVIRMVNDGILSEEIVITDANYISPYDLLIKGRRRYRSLDHDIISSKLFVKREAINNGVWSDQTETVYSAKQHKGKVFDLSFQHGKSFVNNENDIIFTLDLLAVLQEEEIFSKYSKYLYTSACSFGSAKKIKKKYEGNYREFQSNGKEYYIINTKSKIENKFDSELTISVEDYDLLRLKQLIKNPSEVSFKSLKTGKSIQLDSLSLEYAFDTWNGKKVISTLTVIYSYLLNDVRSKNIINLKFFDYENPYIDLISSVDYDLMTDYQKIWNTPYSDDFWNGQKLTFSKLDTFSEFSDLNLESPLLLLRKRYLTLQDVSKLGSKYFEHTPLMDDGGGAMLKVDPLDFKTQRHLNAIFFAQLYEVDNNLKVNMIPLIDHRRSFVLNNIPMMDSMYSKEIEVVKETYTEALKEIKTLDLSKEDSPAKTIRKLVKRYDKLLKDRLSHYDAYQYRDWAATIPKGPGYENRVYKFHKN